MNRLNSHTRIAGRFLGSAMAAALLVSCAGQSDLAHAGGASATAQEQADAREKEVARAEQRVAKSPRDAESRAALAQAYLASGRFVSAATAFEDAMSLGDNSARTGLGAAVAYVGLGRNADALTLLGKLRNDVPASDFGLAVALAGNASAGVDILTAAVRGGEATPKARQNLAYAYALDGRWQEARLIASQDVPAEQLDARLAEWAATAQPGHGQERIAGMVGAPLRSDPGQPVMLALNPSPLDVRVANVEAPAPVAEPTRVAEAELEPVQTGESFWGNNQPAENAAPARIADAEGVAAPSLSFVANPVVQSAPQKIAASPRQAKVAASAPRTTAVASSAKAAGATHLVQLGSFKTMEGAKRAWGIFKARDPKLKDHALRITEAVVNGQRYFRVAAEGFDRTSAETMCSKLRKGGSMCLAYAQTSTLPGTRLASR